jgi:adenylate cyclase
MAGLVAFLLGIPLGSNAITYLFWMLVADIILFPDTLKALNDALGIMGPINLIVSFILPTLICIIYEVSVFNGAARLNNGQNTTEKQRRRLLNTPLFISVIGMLGWPLGISANLVTFRLRSSAFDWYTSSGVLMGGVVSGIACFVIVYYAMEYFNRKYFIHRFFPDNRLSDCSGTVRLSIRARFVILHLAITVFPVLILVAIIRRLQLLVPAGTLGYEFILLISGLLVVTGFLVFMLAKAFQEPLLDLREATDQVQREQFDVRVPVVSNDELGRLSEAVNDMSSGLAEKEFIKDTFGKVVAPSVRDHLLQGNIELGGELRRAAVLFTDIRDFTALSETRTPEQVVRLLNRYFERMSRAVEAGGGLVNKYIGDALMAVFGVPVTMDAPERAAVETALAMRWELTALNEELATEGIPAIRTGIGIHVGDVLAGNIGSSARMEYTVIGDTVNIASRVESLCKEFDAPLLCTDAVIACACLPEDLEYRDLGPVQVKGKSRAVQVFAIGGE